METLIKTLAYQILFSISVVCFVPSTKGQTKAVPYPVVGSRMPDFRFNDVQYYSTNKVTLDSFKGKWLILDFWNRYCSTCIEKMPHMDSLRDEFSKDIQFMLVGYTGSQYGSKFRKVSDDLQIRALFERIRTREKLDLPIAYDSLLFHQFDIGSCPYIVIVGPDGKVKGITYSLSSRALKDLINGKEVSLPRAYRKHEAIE